MRDLRVIFGLAIYLKWKNIKYLVRVINVFTKYTWVKTLKGKKVKQFLMLLSK